MLSYLFFDLLKVVITSFAPSNDVVNNTICYMIAPTEDFRLKHVIHKIYFSLESQTA